MLFNCVLNCEGVSAWWSEWMNEHLKRPDSHSLVATYSDGLGGYGPPLWKRETPYKHSTLREGCPGFQDRAIGRTGP